MKKPPTDLSKTMREIRNRLTRLENLLIKCGSNDELIDRAVKERFDLEDFIEAELVKRECICHSSH